MSTCDLRRLAANYDLDPDMLNAPDEQLITLIWHEMRHRFEQGAVVFAGLSQSLLIRWLHDERVRELLIQFGKETLMPPPAEPAKFILRAETTETYQYTVYATSLEEAIAMVEEGEAEDDCVEVDGSGPRVIAYALDGQMGWNPMREEV